MKIKNYYFPVDSEEWCCDDFSGYFGESFGESFSDPAAAHVEGFGVPAKKPKYNSDDDELPF